MFNPVESLKEMAASGVPQNVLYQTAQVWARLYTDQFNAIYSIMSTYRGPESNPVVTASSSNVVPMSGLTFSPEDFRKKKLTDNAVPVRHADNPIFSGVYEDPKLPIELKAFDNIEAAYSHYQTKDLKSLIKELKKLGFKVFAGANEEQVLSLLNQVDKSVENVDTPNED